MDDGFSRRRTSFIGCILACLDLQCTTPSRFTDSGFTACRIAWPTIAIFACRAVLAGAMGAVCLSLGLGPDALVTGTNGSGDRIMSCDLVLVQPAKTQSELESLQRC